MLLFVDDTVLIDFALLGQFGLLVSLVHGRSRWTAAAADECLRSSRLSGLHDLARAPELFREPLSLETRREFAVTAVIRARMSGPGEGSRHAAAAEAIALISARGPGARASRAAFVTDDRAARVEAARHGILTYCTCDLLRLAVRVRAVTAEEAWEAVDDLRRRGRVLPDSPHRRDDYLRWCSAA